MTAEPTSPPGASSDSHPLPTSIPTPSADDPKPPAGRGRRLGCAAAFLLLLPLLLYGVYLVAVQIFFATGLGERLLSRHPERFRLEWSGGSSWVPGTFEVEGARLRGRTRKGRWEVTADSAKLRLDLRALTERRAVFPEMSLTGVNGSWLSDAADPSDGELPVIDGFSGPYRPPGPRKKGKTPWTLHFQNLEGEIRTLWVDQQRVEAGANAGWANLELVIVPRTRVEIPRLELNMDGATAYADDGGRGEVERLHLRGRVDPFTPGGLKGLAWLELARLELEMAADGWGLGAASYYFRGAPVDLGGVGRAEAHLLLDRGRLLEGSVFALEGDGLRFQYLGYRGSGAGRLSSKVEGEGDAARADLSFVLDSFRLARDRVSDPYVVGKGLRLDASSGSTDLADPAPEIQAELRLESASIPDFSAYDEYIPEGVPLSIVGGTGELSSRMTLDTAKGHAEGKVELVGDDVRAHFEGNEIEADLQLRLQLADGDLESRRFRIDSASLLLDNVESNEITGWWARMEIPEGRAVLAAGRDGTPVGLDAASLEAASIEARVSATLADARPFLALLGDRNRAVRWLERLVGYGRVTVSGQVESNAKALRLLDLDLLAGSHWRGEAQLYLADETYGGIALVNYGRLAGAFEIVESELEEWKVIGAESYYRQRAPLWRERLDVTSPD